MKYDFSSYHGGEVDLSRTGDSSMDSRSRHLSPVEQRHQLQYQQMSLETQRIRDRERELERIHRSTTATPFCLVCYLGTTVDFYQH